MDSTRGETPDAQFGGTATFIWCGFNFLSDFCNINRHYRVQPGHFVVMCHILRVEYIFLGHLSN